MYQGYKELSHGYFSLISSLPQYAYLLSEYSTNEIVSKIKQIMIRTEIKIIHNTQIKKLT